MSIQGPIKTGTIALNGTSTGEIDLGKDYDMVVIEIPTLTSCTLKLQAAHRSGGTFQDIGNSLTTETTTGAYSTTFKLFGWQYIKIVASVAQGAARTFTLWGRSF